MNEENNVLTIKTVQIQPIRNMITAIKDILTDATITFTKDGMKIAKNSTNSTFPSCQTIKVVISPNGENAPPAFATTTTLIQATITNFLFLPPTAITTAPIKRAVVKLSAKGEITKANTPVTQNIPRSVNPRPTNHIRNA